MDLFTQTWDDLRATVAALPDDAFAQPSGCKGWLVRDLVCHLVIDAQDVLITLATPTDDEPTRDAASYWTVSDSIDADDPLAALTVRLAAAYEDPSLLTFHLDDVGSAADRAATLADPSMRVRTQDFVLSAGDYLSAYVLEWTLHHLDLVAHLPGLAGPSAEGLAATRALLERIVGEPFPISLPDADVLLLGTGRRTPSAAEASALGALADRLPLVLG